MKVVFLHKNDQPFHRLKRDKIIINNYARNKPNTYHLYTHRTRCVGTYYYNIITSITCKCQYWQTKHGRFIPPRIRKTETSEKRAKRPWRRNGVRYSEVRRTHVRVRHSKNDAEKGFGFRFFFSPPPNVPGARGGRAHSDARFRPLRRVKRARHGPSDAAVVRRLVGWYAQRFVSAARLVDLSRERARPSNRARRIGNKTVSSCGVCVYCTYR